MAKDAQKRIEEREAKLKAELAKISVRKQIAALQAQLKKK